MGLDCSPLNKDILYVGFWTGCHEGASGQAFYQVAVKL